MMGRMYVVKRMVFAALFTLFFVTTVFSDPAKEGIFSVKQPNGVTIRLMLHGDERVHYTTTEDGYLVAKNRKDYYCYVKISKDTTMVIMPQKVGISRRPSAAAKPTDALLQKMVDRASKRWQE